MTGRSQFSETNLVGQRIGNYAIMERLGKGGMGVVYRALKLDDSALKIPLVVALKYPTTELSDASLARFQREMDLLSRLSSPYLVGIKDVGVHEIDGEQRPYYAMEFIENVTLQTLLRDMHTRSKPLHIDAAIYIFYQVLKALEYLHHGAMDRTDPQQVIHRDISPDNILIRRPMVSVTLTDFGIASVVSEQSTGTSLVGKPRYMSPEALEVDHERTTKMDLWSTAVVVWEMLHSDRFLGGLDNDMQVYSAILDHKLPGFDPSIPPRIVDLLERMLDGDPAERPSAPEARDELQSICEELDIRTERGESKLYKTMLDLYGSRSTSGKSEAFIPIIDPALRPPTLEAKPPSDGSQKSLQPNPFDEDSPTIAIASPSKTATPTRVDPVAAPPTTAREASPDEPTLLVHKHATTPPPSKTQQARTTSEPPESERIPKELRELPGVESEVVGEKGWFVRFPKRAARELPVIQDKTVELPPPPPRETESPAPQHHADTIPAAHAQTATLPPDTSDALSPPQRELSSILPWLTAIFALAAAVFGSLLFFS